MRANLPNNEKNHPIIALWAHPRSMSTATERIMRERGDVTCLHEPFMYFHYIAAGNTPFAWFDADEDQPHEFVDIMAMLEASARDRPVFFKDMAYYVVPRLFEHAGFAKRLVHVFIIRDPRKAILSYYKLDQNLKCEEVGHAAQWKLFEWLANKANDEEKSLPLIIEAEKMQQSPRDTMGRVWQYIGLPTADHAFDWSNKQSPEDWQAVAGWHQSALASTGIRPEVRQSETELAQAFESLANEAPRLQDYLDHHWPCYERLRAASRKQFNLFAKAAGLV